MCLEIKITTQSSHLIKLTNFQQKVIEDIENSTVYLKKAKMLNTPDNTSKNIFIRIASIDYNNNSVNKCRKTKNKFGKGILISSINIKILLSSVSAKSITLASLLSTSTVRENTRKKYRPILSRASASRPEINGHKLLPIS